MNVSSARTFDDISPVLYNKVPEGPNPVYIVISDIQSDNWSNMTITGNGLIGGEYPKTYGHYHKEGMPIETYKLIAGEGCLMFQSKFIENDQPVWNKVSEVIIVFPKPGEEIKISNKWGHSWSNLGKGPLITVDDWKNGHTLEDYEQVTKNKGFAYFLIEENGKPKHVANPNYLDLPEPKYMSVEEFAKHENLAI